MKNQTILNNEKELYAQLLSENHALVDYALSKGLELTDNINLKLKYLFPEEDDTVYDSSNDKEKIIELSTMHNELCQLVEPAKPASIILIDKDEKYNFFGPVKLIRQLIIASIISLMAFMLTSLSTFVTSETLNKEIFDLSGSVLIANLLCLLSLSAFGGCLYALYKSHQYVQRRTYDPKYSSSYWSRIVIGIFAGLILAELLPIAEPKELTRPTTALIVGFSVNHVIKILARIFKILEVVLSPMIKSPISQKENVDV